MILFSNNKTCSYEVEYKKDCSDAEVERVNDGWGDNGQSY